ncbi:MAG: acyl-ACP--UDP-N-acetylglucosamine O-acyltransferase [Nitrospinae bacterium]|nr:acyl-ACP--UDP-N-acetylglucosamine O-acyltransferase [Nitrospinota bacterium]
MSVHPTAIVHRDAKVDPSAEVGPFAIIEADVEIGARCVIGPYVWLNHARIGEGTKIGGHTLIGGDPQALKWNEVPAIVRIGRDNDIRELVSIHRSMYENGETVVGDGNFIMSNTHIGHDCALGNSTIITTYAGLSGHVTVQDQAIIGGQAGIHQFVRIGEMAMIGGMARIVQDVAPYMLAEGSPADIRNYNVVGLKRKGYSEKARANIKEAFKVLFKSGLNLKSARLKLAEIPDAGGEMNKILDFVNTTKRGLTGV